MHAEHGAWPPPSSAYSFGMFFLFTFTLLPVDFVKNHSILSIILNSTLGRMHLRLDPVARLCLSLFLDLTPCGSSQHQVNFLSQGSGEGGSVFFTKKSGLIWDMEIFCHTSEQG